MCERVHVCVCVGGGWGGVVCVCSGIEGFWSVGAEVIFFSVSLFETPLSGAEGTRSAAPALSIWNKYNK